MQDGEFRGRLIFISLYLCQLAKSRFTAATDEEGTTLSAKKSVQNELWLLQAWLMGYFPP